MRITFGLKASSEDKNRQLKERWVFNSQNTLLAPPIIYEDANTGKKSILFGTKEGKIYSLDKDSNVNWMFDAKEFVSEVDLMFFDIESVNSIESSPNIYDLNGDGNKEIIFGSEMGAVCALNHTGELMWKFNAEGSVRGGVLIKDLDGDGKPKVIFGSGDKHLYILNNEGELLNKIEIDSSIESTPETIGKSIVFGCNNGKVYCMKTTGEIEWTFQTGGKITAQPTVDKIKGTDEEFIIIGSVDHCLYLLDTKGDLIWKYNTEGAIYSKAATADINEDGKMEIIFGSCDNKVYALDYRGEKIWSYETDFWVVAPVIVTDIDNDGKLEIIAGSYDHNLYILDAKGNYILDYIPGLTGVMQQTGSYTDVLTSQPGTTTGKKIWQYQTEDVIVGCATITDNKEIVVNTKKGKVNNLGLEKR